MLTRPSALEGAPAAKRRCRSHPSEVVAALGAAAVVLQLASPAASQQAVTLNGPPVQVQATSPEPGVPLITITPGTPNPLPSGGTGTGPGDDGSGGNVGDSNALTTMVGTPWGSQAIANAQAMGVNASALAATCVLESGCQNIGGSGTITGAFQMMASTYTAMMNEALAANPSLAGQIVPGLAGQNDPATQSIAAAQYLIDGAQALQNAGVANPTVLDTRGFYNFGPKYGVGIATAPDSAPMSQVLAGSSPALLTSNGITPGETVGQWRAVISAKIGNAAGQSVLT